MCFVSCWFALLLMLCYLVLLTGWLCWFVLFAAYGLWFVFVCLTSYAVILDFEFSGWLVFVLVLVMMFWFVCFAVYAC